MNRGKVIYNESKNKIQKEKLMKLKRDYYLGSLIFLIPVSISFLFAIFENDLRMKVILSFSGCLFIFCTLVVINLGKNLHYLILYENGLVLPHKTILGQEKYVPYKNFQKIKINKDVPDKNSKEPYILFIGENFRFILELSTIENPNEFISLLKTRVTVDSN